MTQIAMTSPIATRRLRFQRGDGSEVEVAVTLGPDPQDPTRTWACPYEITGPVKRKVHAVENGGRFVDDEDLSVNNACRANLDRTT